ncbi:hypothetical protein GCM10022284_22650 [Streptomyces hundungensis]
MGDPSSARNTSPKISCVSMPASCQAPANGGGGPDGPDGRDGPDARACRGRPRPAFPPGGVAGRTVHWEDQEPGVTR